MYTLIWNNNHDNNKKEINKRIGKNRPFEIISRTRDLISRLAAIPQGFAKKRFAASDASNPVPLIRPLKMNISSKREVARIALISALCVERFRPATTVISTVVPSRALSSPSFFSENYTRSEAARSGNQIRFLLRPSSREEETKRSAPRESGKVTSGQRLVKGMKKGAW